MMSWEESADEMNWGRGWPARWNYQRATGLELGDNWDRCSFDER